MTVAELIEKLQAALARYGDVEIQVVTRRIELLPIMAVGSDVYEVGGPTVVEIMTGEESED